VVEVYGVLRIAGDGIVTFDSIRHVGIGEGPTCQQGSQSFWVVVYRELKELGEVDDLMISPISDVRPRIIWLNHFPIDSISRYAIGIVSVNSRGIDEFGNHTEREFRITECQGLPILKNVAPVALVIPRLLSQGIAGFNGEVIPWPTRVTVSSAEREWQVLKIVPHQVLLLCGR